MKTKRFDISFIAPLFLFAFFSICVMSVLIMGADLYRKQTQRDLVGYNHRTVSQYISTRIHQSDKHDSFFVSDFNTQTPQSKGNAFFFTEIINGSEYYTCIYSHDGYLYEQNPHPRQTNTPMKGSDAKKEHNHCRSVQHICRHQQKEKLLYVEGF